MCLKGEGGGEGGSSGTSQYDACACACVLGAFFGRTVLLLLWCARNVTSCQDVVSVSLCQRGDVKAGSLEGIPLGVVLSNQAHTHTASSKPKCTKLDG